MIQKVAFSYLAELIGGVLLAPEMNSESNWSQNNFCSILIVETVFYVVVL